RGRDGWRPQRDSLSIHLIVAVVEPAWRIVVNSLLVGPRATVESPSQSTPHGLPREAAGRQKRLLGSGGIFLLLGPPSSAWAVSVSLTGTRLERSGFHPKVWESLGWLQDPDIEHRRAGLCQKCVNRDGPIVWRPSFQRKGPKEPDATANIQRADGLPKNPNLGPSD